MVWRCVEGGLPWNLELSSHLDSSLTPHLSVFLCSEPIILHLHTSQSMSRCTQTHTATHSRHTHIHTNTSSQPLTGTTHSTGPLTPQQASAHATHQGTLAHTRHRCIVQSCSELVGVQYKHGELSFCTHLKGKDFLEGLGL